MKISDKDKKRFWSKVNIGEPDDCWEWAACLSNKGYGVFEYKYKNWLAHRFSWSLINEEIPSGMFVCHHCDNPKCVNPKYLFLGTHYDNTQDMVNKGRQNKAKGEEASRTILTEQNVIEIRQSTESYIKLAECYKVTPRTISQAATGESWKYISIPSQHRKLLNYQKREILSLL